MRARRDWGRRDHVALLVVCHHIDVVYRTRISFCRVGQDGDVVDTLLQRDRRVGCVSLDVKSGLSFEPAKDDGKGCRALEIQRWIVEKSLNARQCVRRVVSPAGLRNPGIMKITASTATVRTL